MKTIFERLTGKKHKSASQAKDRLQLVLIHDRADLSPGLLENMRDELIEVISRYIEIDASAVRLEINQTGRERKLVADIPLRSRRGYSR